MGGGGGGGGKDAGGGEDTTAVRAELAALRAAKSALQARGGGAAGGGGFLAAVSHARNATIQLTQNAHVRARALFDVIDKECPGTVIAPYVPIDGCCCRGD